jgi:hypothetical protein
MMCEAIPINVPYSKAQKRHEKNVINPGIRSSSGKKVTVTKIPEIELVTTINGDYNFHRTKFGVMVSITCDVYFF